MLGNIFSIEEFSVYDGPGIRTTVFLKGCPLRCSWCHNPEGQLFESEVVKKPNGCIGCGQCKRFQKVENGKVVLLEESIKFCPSNLIRVCGEKMTAEELCERLMKNKRILENGGGVTFSGGEPLAQSDFLFECLTLLKGKLHTAIQTSGYCDPAVFEKALGLADYFLFDLKLIDEEQHLKFTGVSNKKILKNFESLAKHSNSFTARTPLIPEVTDTSENISAIARLLNRLDVKSIELLPYNKMAGGKYKMVMREYCPGFDEEKPVNPHIEIFEEYKIKTKIL